jgi:hypothetical protein
MDDQIHSRFCKTILGVPRFAADSVAEVELGGTVRGKSSEHDWEMLLKFPTHGLSGNSKDLLGMAAK